MKYKDKGVCGFGVFGPDIRDLRVDSVYEWCPDTIRYLKDRNINICIAAGKSG